MGFHSFRELSASRSVRAPNVELRGKCSLQGAWQRCIRLCTCTCSFSSIGVSTRAGSAREQLDNWSMISLLCSTPSCNNRSDVSLNLSTSCCCYSSHQIVSSDDVLLRRPMGNFSQWPIFIIAALDETANFRTMVTEYILGCTWQYCNIAGNEKGCERFYRLGYVWFIDTNKPHENVFSGVDYSTSLSFEMLGRVVLDGRHS